MKNAAKVIRDNSLRYAKLMTDEMGKPITDGLAELEKCASCCEYFAEMSDKFLKPIPLDMSVGYSGSSDPPRLTAVQAAARSVRLIRVHYGDGNTKILTK